MIVTDEYEFFMIIPYVPDSFVMVWDAFFVFTIFPIDFRVLERVIYEKNQVARI